MPQLLRRLRLVSLALAALLMLAACGGRAKAPEHAPAPSAGASEAQPGKPAEAAITAGALRVTLNNAFREHVFLASAVTGATLAGNTEVLKAASRALQQGTAVDLADLVGKIYDPETRERFLKLWSSHIDMVMAYTNGLAKGDQAAVDKAVADLAQYAKDLSAELEKITGLPASTSEPLVAHHVATLRSVIDKQKAGDAIGAYTDLRAAMSHMDTIAKPLAAQIAAQKRYAGTVDGAAADLQTRLNALLQERAFLAGAVTGAAVSGNAAGFEAAAKAGKEGNSVDLASTVSGVYEQGADPALVGALNSHADLFTAYTTGLANGDKAAQDKAVGDMRGYVGNLAIALEQATQGGLARSASMPLLQQHVTSLKTVVDLQRSGNQGAAYISLRETARQMRMIADSLAQAIAKQKNLS